MTFGQALLHGFWRDLPPFRLVLGLCPSLAVTAAASNGLGMGVDRLCMVLSGAETIRDVILFPQLKPRRSDEASEQEKDSPGISHP